MTTGPYAGGLLFFQDRANTLKAVFNSNDDFGKGTIYFPEALVDLNPNSNLNLQVIADMIKVNNNGPMRASYQGIPFFQPYEEPQIALVY